MTPKVSVIVPNYNHARYLKRRIDSIILQEYSDFELLLLDDCSSDNSYDILCSYLNIDERVSIISNEKNSGSTFKQWQKGLSLARGEYVWIAESDDFAEPEFLAKMVPILDNNPKIALAYTNSWVIDEYDKVHGTTADWKNAHFNTQRWSHNYYASGNTELQDYLSKACTINNASAVLFRRSSVEAVGIDTSFRYTGDWLLYIKLCFLGSVAYVGECLSNYREHTANASKKSIADGSQLFERLKCCAFIYDSGRLSAVAADEMMNWCKRELLALNFLLLRQSWQPRKMWAYAKGISAVNLSFYLRLQSYAFRLAARRKG